MRKRCRARLPLMYGLQLFLPTSALRGGEPATGKAAAHGELTGVLMMRAYHLDRGESQRDIILVPDSAHGYNPATTSNERL